MDDGQDEKGQGEKRSNEDAGRENRNLMEGAAGRFPGLLHGCKGLEGILTDDSGPRRGGVPNHPPLVIVSNFFSIFETQAHASQI